MSSPLHARPPVVLFIAVASIAVAARAMWLTADPPSDPTVGIVWHDEGAWVHSARNKAIWGEWRTDSWNPVFLAPVFYPVDALPENVRPWLYLNPLTFIIEQARAVLLWGMAPDWVGLLKHGAAGLAICVGGYWAFQRLRKGFADVL